MVHVLTVTEGGCCSRLLNPPTTVGGLVETICPLPIPDAVCVVVRLHYIEQTQAQTYRFNTLSIFYYFEGNHIIDGIYQSISQLNWPTPLGVYFAYGRL